MHLQLTYSRISDFLIGLSQTTKAVGCCPCISCGLPTTAASFTQSCDSNTDSKYAGATYKKITVYQRNNVTYR